MSFAHAPVTKGFMLSLGILSLFLAIMDIKHYAQIQLKPHISRDHQYWRLFSHHLAYTNSSELFVAELLLYHIAIPIERCFGSAKFASFAVVSSLLSTLFAFASLLAFNHLGLNYIPAGPTALIISIVYQYYRVVPSTYTFRISSVAFSNKIFRYILAAQLLLSHPPGTLVTVLIGLLAGALYRADVLGLNAFRLSPLVQSLSDRLLRPLIGNTQPPRRTNRALPDPYVPRTRPGSGALLRVGGRYGLVVGGREGQALGGGEEEAITTVPSSTRSPHSPSSRRETTTTSSGASPTSADETDNRANTRRSVIGQWVSELTGTPVRVPSGEEITQLSSMFPDASQERIIRSLQRSPDTQRAVEMMLAEEA